MGEGVRPAPVPRGLREGGRAPALDQETLQVKESGSEVNIKLFDIIPPPSF